MRDILPSSQIDLSLKNLEEKKKEVHTCEESLKRMMIIMMFIHDIFSLSVLLLGGGGSDLKVDEYHVNVPNGIVQKERNDYLQFLFQTLNKFK